MDSSSFVRDAASDALININDSEYRKFIAERQKIKQEQIVKDQIKLIFEELRDIRSQLKQLMVGK